MRKIIVTEFMTLDGVIEAPGGNETPHPHGGWEFKYDAPETGEYKVKELHSVDALLLGKNTYEQFAGYWPNSTDNTFGDPINRYPKYVVSTSLEKADWHNSHILRNVAKEVAELKKTDGGDILVYGSATLVKSLLHHNLVDELRLMIFPLSIGGGLRIFDDSRELKKFSLKHAQILSNGVLILEYEPIGV
ncbi:dihydrofolate reductase family protein [Emticicia sp. BO119]|uniref:dihydrofolate reductase family protein n=1 Tax=Emticicia sp. BO119 TaxID=2757768 RepID=UPI0015F02E82|nr:dihydrofolate reductase family protein [Emticicia sp. BO119]MBA4851417.1 dihydrofolate reductase family protein [Emticicia sp. BO119]